uniref:Uncharacterized protein n=1 Tax=Arundo donax TaxID=35708 RepID=A0A0A9GCL7_ARUDO
MYFCYVLSESVIILLHLVTTLLLHAIALILSTNDIQLSNPIYFTYTLAWNITGHGSFNYFSSMQIVAIIYGALYFGLSSLVVPSVHPVSNTKREDNEWWILPTILFLVKSLQAGLVNWHVANLEIQDYSLFSPDPDRFWAM